MVNRLKPLFPTLFSSMQIFFVRGRQILDGIVTTHEEINSLKSLKSNGMMIKFDLSKPYDRLSWSIFMNILKAFGFNPRWI